MLYKKNVSKSLDKELFKNPSAEYRATPFWAWNCKLDKETLTEQIEYLKEMGFGGFHMHSRAGMATEYLSEDFFDLIKTCIEKAKDENMLAWLYDEDRWSSGTAGGFVTKNKKYRRKFLIMTPEPESGEVSMNPNDIEKGITSLISCYDIIKNEKGELLSYKQIGFDDNTRGEKWYAYVKNEEESGWYNGQTYVDTLSKEATDEFIKLTHESYKAHVGNDFEKYIPAIFTDEPQHARKICFKNSKITEVKETAVTTWTLNIEKIYAEKYGLDLIKNLPEIFWELPNSKVSQIRYYYHDLVSELFVKSYMDNCGEWCEKNNIKLTGHVLSEESIPAQVSVVSDAMRCYRKMGLPGIDLLCDNIELSTAKQAQSVVHQYGKEGMLSELYGVTNWDFDFRGHKFQGDWQAALGVTIRVPHLSWVSMKGSAKRDYPASINYQSPWYKEYSTIENHFARVNTALTRGKPIVKVGVISPIETYWLRYGPEDLTSDIKKNIESDYQNLINNLLFGTIDFDLIDEALMSEIGACTSEKLTIGEMDYSAVIIPASCETLRLSTFKLLTQFKKNGGNLIFLGKCPQYIEGKENNEIQKLFEQSQKINNDNPSILNALESERIISILNEDKSRTDNLIYTLRKDNDCSWLFIAHAKRFAAASRHNMQHSIDIPYPENITIKINGKFISELYDTITGNIIPMDCTYENGCTVINTSIYCRDSLLINLKNGHTKPVKETKKQKKYKTIDFKNLVSYSLCEDNVCLLDMAEYSLDGGEFMPLEEVLRIDEKCRKPLDFPAADGQDCQPWCIEEEKIEHYVTLKYEIASEIEVENVRFAAEEAEKIIFNDTEISTKPCGYYVDKSIHTYNLPNLKKGNNILLVTVPFGKRISIEACYLIGKFGVQVFGATKKIIPLPQKIAFDTLTTQGFPFYGGNITYEAEFELDNSCEVEVSAIHYRGALIKAAVDEKEVGNIIFPPYELNIGKLSAGKHILKLTLFGTRVNTFGSLHNFANDNWFGPGHWYSKDGNGWSYEYNLNNTGILSSPIIKLI